MTLVEFLLARLDEDEAEVDDTEHLLGCDGPCTCAKIKPHWRFHPGRLHKDIEAKRAIIAWHQNWPVLVEKPEKMVLDDPKDFGSHTLSYSVHIEKEIAWFTQEEYRKKFGDEPPTGPIIRIMAEVYADHPDYDPGWA